MAIVKVNRSGKSYPIYKENNADEQIGTLYNNELFTWKSAWEGNTAGYSYQAISFRASDGSLAHGWIAASESDKVLANNICSLAKFTKKSTIKPIMVSKCVVLKNYLIALETLLSEN